MTSVTSLVFLVNYQSFVTISLIFFLIIDRGFALQSLYSNSAIDFIKNYWYIYDLFHIWNLTSQDLAKDSSHLRPIHFDYNIRNYSDSFSSFTSNLIKNKLEVNTDQFVENDDSTYDNEIDNRFRFGKIYYERFLNVVFDENPWNPNVQNVHLHFVGVFVESGRERRRYTDFTNRKFTCRFTYPMTIESEIQLYAANMQFNANVEVYCPIPREILNILHDKGHEIPRIVVDFVERESKSHPKENITLLQNIEVLRLDSIDLRYFNVSLATTTKNLNSDILYEWILYHSLIGVEHFYIYNLDRRDMDFNKLQLKPFLDANIITIIHWPYLPVTNQKAITIEHIAMYDWLKKYGFLNKFIGDNSIHQFYFPAIQFHSLIIEYIRKHPIVNNPLIGIFNSLGCSHISKTCTGIGFDIIEYVFDENILLKTPPLGSGYVFECYWRGQPLHEIELKDRLGSYFVRPNRIKLLSNEHFILPHDMIDSKDIFMISSKDISNSGYFIDYDHARHSSHLKNRNFTSDFSTKDFLKQVFQVLKE